jgi:hypothetical protein
MADSPDYSSKIKHSLVREGIYLFDILSLYAKAQHSFGVFVILISKEHFSAFIASTTRGMKRVHAPCDKYGKN